MCRNHAAHLYLDSESLCEAIARFVNSGLERGEAAIVVATPAHQSHVAAELKARGCESEALLAAGQLIYIDATDLLPKIMHRNHPDRMTFDALIRPMIERAIAQFGGVCAYGEMVDLLWEQKNHAAAETLERWWNELIAELGFTLLCGYRADIFDAHSQAHLDAVRRAHTHLIPVVDDERLTQAVRGGIKKALPNGDAEAMHAMLVERGACATQMPPGQAALFALEQLAPSLAQDVRMWARRYYYQPE